MSQFKQLLISLFAKRSYLVFIWLLLISVPTAVYAETIGVGVGTGRIVLDEPIKPSMTYNLPSIAVFNNGDVESDYEMTVQYNETQAENKPPAEWVAFSPSNFKLEPGKAQQVSITLKPEYSATPGDYFAYLEAHPLKKDESGSTAVSVAAATKFHFKVVPANMFMRIYYALLAFWISYRLILIPVIAALVLAVLVLLAKRYLNIEVKRKKSAPKAKDNKDAKDKEE